MRCDDLYSNICKNTVKYDVYFCLAFQTGCRRYQSEAHSHNKNLIIKIRMPVLIQTTIRLQQRNYMPKSRSSFDIQYNANDFVMF
jgi:hypothetical protein